MAGRFFRVRNFERFQHYRDRAPIWIKLYNSLLDDYEFGALPDATRLHLVMIWLLASRQNNRLPMDPTWIGQRISASEPVDLDALLAAGFLELEQLASNVLPLTEQGDTGSVPREEKSRGREEKNYAQGGTTQGSTTRSRGEG